MNGAITSLIVIASLGLLAVLGAGIYFAIKPKFDSKPQTISIPGSAAGSHRTELEDDSEAKTQTHKPVTESKIIPQKTVEITGGCQRLIQLHSSPKGSGVPHEAGRLQDSALQRRLTTIVPPIPLVVEDYEEMGALRLDGTSSPSLRPDPNVLIVFPASDSTDKPASASVLSLAATSKAPNISLQRQSQASASAKLPSSANSVPATAAAAVSSNRQTLAINPSSPFAPPQPTPEKFGRSSLVFAGKDASSGGPHPSVAPIQPTSEQGSVILDPRKTDRQNVDLVQTVLEKQLIDSYGKIVGLTISGDKLYVPSFTNGKIGIFSLPELKLERELTCAQCTIYDIGVLTNGDIVVALGKQKKLRKLSGTNGTVLREASLQVATKGLAVNQHNEVFVLGWSDGTVYVYDDELTLIGPIAIPMTTRQDCNFIAVNETDICAVSCEDHVYIFDFQGQLLKSLTPPSGSYSVGVAFDEWGSVVAVRRGTGTLDIYSNQGVFVDTIGEAESGLWSDVVVKDGRLYVVDYLSTKLKMFKYRK